MKKLEHSIPQIIDDDNLYSHMIDEILLFNKELHMAHNYQSTEHSCLHVLTTDACLQRWVELEKNCKYFRVAFFFLDSYSLIIIIFDCHIKFHFGSKT